VENVRIVCLHIAMICPRWLSRARHRIAGHPASTARSLTRAATRPLAPDALARGRDGPAAASTRPLRSYSTPTTPLGTPLSADAAPEEKKAKSSVPAGALLTGLAYVKGADPPAAMEDDEYPAWLWGLLDETKGDGAADGAEERGDSYCEHLSTGHGCTGSNRRF
jgi:large subunit ribosomal protein L54